jgi:Domain of unknown function (DUF4157)
VRPIAAAGAFAALYRVGGHAPDLSDVRIHYSGTGAVCRRLGALAFTVGRDIYIRPDCYAPQTPAGLWLLAHEIAHVVQQRYGRPAAMAPGRRGAGPAHCPHEEEADAAAWAALAGRPFAFASLPTPWRVQKYMAWEHLLLGSLGPAAMRQAIPGQGSGTADAAVSQFAAQCALLGRLGKDPRISQDRLAAGYPHVPGVRLASSGLVVTLAELTILPDYFSHPDDIDAAPAAYLIPLVQSVRAMNYRKLQRLTGRAAPRRPGWSALRYPNGQVLADVREAVEVDSLGKRCARPAWERYSSVLSRNASHFAPFSWYRWQAFHLKARELIERSAATAGEERRQLRRAALIYAGYADHFLHDSFAAGHLVNKTLIMQWYVEWLSRSRLPLADRALLTAMTCQHQPALHGPGLYDPKPVMGTGRMCPGGDPSPLAVTDPQTALEGATIEERIKASGITGASTQDRLLAYVRFLALLGSGVAQVSASAVHGYLNKRSVVAAHCPEGARYRLWGDGTMFADGEGAVQAATAAQASRRAITELLESGHTDISSRQIFERFPRYVEVDGALLSLPEWHETTLRPWCLRTLFRHSGTQAKRLAMTLTARRLGVPAEDYQQLRARLRA